MGRRRWTEFGSRSVNLYPRRLHPREREEKLEGRWVATSTWGAHHSDVVDVLDEGRREQRERRGGDNGCHGILLLDVNIILGAGDYCAWAAPPVCTQKVWAGRSSLTEVIESPRGEEGNAVKGETLMSPYKFATFIQRRRFCSSPPAKPIRRCYREAQDRNKKIILCQQYGRVRARCIAAAAVPLASDFLFFVAAAAALQAHPCDVAGRLVAHHVPQPVARQDQALVALLPIQHPHLRLRNHILGWRREKKLRTWSLPMARDMASTPRTLAPSQ
ncbi:hypothetical protein MUK42_19061 [Musa troglodytarum]|uniref:Uncharacterized protein n=1 Tax=Musa troglodytarum TaxID=320322 RepID=A0A9E7JHG6_9LILI|nr:hypothetical protein MUK42_19061 [Musa troglodytarum]